MCGITGIVSNSSRSELSTVLREMTDVISYRGPDDSGYYETRSDQGKTYVGLGHRRLSIIDLSTGHQPMSNEDNSIHIVFNGEIYNFPELRKDLAAKNHVFQTNSDTEAIIHLYEEYGAECAQYLRGMFAFAIWDEHKERLFIARDRFGKKPLFYFIHDGILLFSSEIKSILKFSEFKFEINHDVLTSYLIYRYVPGPDTLFKGIMKLQPGNVAVWEKGRFQMNRYYAPPDGKPNPGSGTNVNVVQSFLNELDEAVRIRMVSDVPYGAFLSGGIDSSAIVALMTRHSSFPVKTFSVGFQEDRYDEAPYARMIAKKFGTEHHELIITADHLMDELPRLIYHRDAPVSETADIPIFLLSQYARQMVKMVLTGEGSDEMLGGYPKHVYERFVPIYQIFPALIRAGLIEPLVRALPYRFYRAKTAIANLGLSDNRERLPRWFGSLTKEEVGKLLDRSYLGEHNINEFQFETDSATSRLRRILYFDQTSWLPDNLLERGDRMTMAASLEARMPFMDHKLADFISKLPDNCRVRGMTTKWILREAMKPILPYEIIYRPKVGFRVPVNEWFQHSMRDYLYDHLTGPGSLTAAYYKKNALLKVLDEHSSGRQNHEKLLWCLLNLELWHKKYFKP